MPDLLWHPASASPWVEMRLSPRGRAVAGPRIKSGVTKRQAFTQFRKTWTSRRRLRLTTCRCAWRRRPPARGNDAAPRRPDECRGYGGRAGSRAASATAVRGGPGEAGAVRASGPGAAPGRAGRRAAVWSGVRRRHSCVALMGSFGRQVFWRTRADWWSGCIEIKTDGGIACGDPVAAGAKAFQGIEQAEGRKLPLSPGPPSRGGFVHILGMAGGARSSGLHPGRPIEEDCRCAEVGAGSADRQSARVRPCSEALTTRSRDAMTNQPPHSPASAGLQYVQSTVGNECWAQRGGPACTAD